MVKERLFFLSCRSNVIGIVKLRDFALITPEQYHLTVKHLMEFHMRKIINNHIIPSMNFSRSIWLYKNLGFIVSSHARISQM